MPLPETVWHLNLTRAEMPSWTPSVFQSLEGNPHGCPAWAVLWRTLSVSGTMSVTVQSNTHLWCPKVLKNDALVLLMLLGRWSSEEWLKYLLNMWRTGWFAQRSSTQVSVTEGLVGLPLWAAADPPTFQKTNGSIRRLSSEARHPFVYVVPSVSGIFTEDSASGDEFSEERRALVTWCLSPWPRAGDQPPVQNPSRGVGDLDSSQCQGPCSPDQIEVPSPQGSSGCSETVLSFKTKVSLDLKENAGPNLVYSLWTSLPFTLQRVSFSEASEKASLLGDWEVEMWDSEAPCCKPLWYLRPWKRAPLSSQRLVQVSYSEAFSFMMWALLIYPVCP